MVRHAFAHSPRIAMKSCKGPGKSCILAILAWNFLLCYPHSIAGATSINAPNLYSNLWVELARWKAKAKGNLLEGLFETTTKEIRHREHPETRKLQARTWKADATPEQIGNALAGLHADYVAWFMDETGDYPDAIMPTVEAIFAGSPRVARIVQAGNPTRLSGPLYTAVSKARHLWTVIDITADPDDPRRTPRHAREQIGLYGRDNPWVLVNIFGQFPPSSLNALIGPEEVRAAMARYWQPLQIGSAPEVLGVDVARFGDDQSIICCRQGIQVFEFKTYRNLDSTQGASEVTRAWSAFDADACFVDDTGGFGSGWLDQLRVLGCSPIAVSFAGKAHEHGRFRNMRGDVFRSVRLDSRRRGAAGER
jgi:phage terminase large subunit